jgi:serine-protein kinase ATM
MGPLGIQGIFKKAAEATLTALKENSGALLTILSAIVADPLYKWSINSFDNRRKQLKEEPPLGKKLRKSIAIKVNEKLNDGTYDEADDNEKKNEAAAHAMRKIQEKLQGYEDGTSGEQQSVEGQVSFLINSARDVDNLCVMFPGWAPWC